MDTQSRPERAAQTILIVEEDEALRGILDHSLRHAGFAVGLASTVDEAFRRLDDGPDLVIAGASGLEICRRAKQLTDRLPPAVVLISEPGVENKTRGLEAGADDFVVKPIYVQEVVARAKALLQRRERERLELSASGAAAETGSERFLSDIADVPLVDLVRAVAAHQKSGVASITAPTGARGEIFFRQGNVVDAEVGRLSGRDAVYRLFCWTAGNLEVEWKSIRRKDIVETRPQELLIEALARVDEWQRLLAGLPALDTVFEVDYRMLAERLADIPDEVNRILRLFDGGRSLLQVIDDSAMPDLHAAAIISRLCHERIIHDARLSVSDDDIVGSDRDGWLSDAAGPFRGPPRTERELFGVLPESAPGLQEPAPEPQDSPAEGATEAVDDEMSARFTDRLNAEEPAEPAPWTDLPPVPSSVATPVAAQAEAFAAPLASAAESGAQNDAALPTTPENRFASGEITVRAASAKARHSPAAEERLAHLREENARSFVRASQSLTPAGSARALDEPPPLLDGPLPEPSPRSTTELLRATAVERAVEVQRFTRAVPDDLEPPTRRRGLVLVALTAVGVLVVGATVLGLYRRSTSSEGQGQGGEVAAAAAPPAPAPPPPAPAARAELDVQRTAVTARDGIDDRVADPKLARAWADQAPALLGACRDSYQEARMKDAEAACTAARDANPDSAEANGYLAHVLFNRNRRPEALAAAERAVKLDAKLADAYLVIGGIHQDAGEMSEAKRAYQRYLELQPHGSKAGEVQAIVERLGKP
ncbi:MAG TPA: DUF4388 domain-containing protein [Polyangia bacterium]|nr:DUF4388 domain-containing protein [Polyangia bacterium]